MTQGPAEDLRRAYAGWRHTVLKRCAGIIIAAVVLFAALFLAVKAELIRPNMIFVPKGVQGVDTSEYQGAVSFEALSNAHVQFVYAKATEGATHHDSQFAATCEQASNSPIALGAYHFFSFDSAGSTQAENFVSSAAKAWNDPTVRSLRPAVDVEWYSDKEQNPPQVEDVQRELKAFLETVEATCGKKPLIYTGNDIYDRYLHGCFDDYDLWISCRKWPSWVEWPQGNWTIWQYSDVGKVSGAANETGHVDLDVLAKDVSVDDLLI